MDLAAFTTAANWIVVMPGVDRLRLRSSYLATGRSNVECAAAAWLQLVSLSTIEKVEMCQRYAGRAIIGQVKITPLKQY